MTNDSEPGSRFNRRTYLQLAGGVAATAGCVGRQGAGSPETQLRVLKLVGYGGAMVTTGTSFQAVEAGTSEVEPNDTRADATPILKNQEVSGRLEADEVDWYAFDAEAGEPLTVRLDRQNRSGVSLLALYDPDGTFENQVYLSGGITPLETTAATAGTYFVQVVDVEDGASPYTLTVEGNPDETPTSTPTPTPTPTTTEQDDDYGEQGYGEFGFGGVMA